MIKATEKFKVRWREERIKLKKAEAKNDERDTESKVKKEREGRREGIKAERDSER